MQAVRCGWRPALLALALCTPCAAAESFSWGTDLEAAKQAAARGNKLVLLHFGATWCQPCQQLEREVFSKPGFGKELKQHYVGVKLDFDHFPATARQYGVQSIPTDVILTPDGKVVERLQSPLNAQTYVTSLSRVAVIAQQRAPAGQAPGPGLAPPAAGAAPVMVANAAGQPTGRYANYNSQQPAAPPQQNAYAAAQPGNPAPQPTMSQAPGGAAPPAYAAAGPAPGAAAGPAPGQAGAAAHDATPLVTTPHIPAGNAPLGLDGFCPVSLCEKQAWTPGDVRWGMQHRGRTYLFAGPTELQRFCENPDRYSPIMSGNDPVLALDRGQMVPGNRMFGVYYGGHVYLFASEQELQTFTQNPIRYSPEAVQARR